MGRLIRIFVVLLALSACGEEKAPKPMTDAAPDSRPVKNVESLPSGTIREGARTINKAADTGESLEQQKQARDGEIESQGK